MSSAVKKEKPILSIGMAVYNDYDGLYFTIQALRVYHADILARCEIIVVDNKPEAPGGQALIHPLLGNIAPHVADVKYIPVPPELTGTTQPRNQVFAAASADYVLCMDSHVLLLPEALDRLLKYYQENPKTRDLISGPLMYDDLKALETHFNDVWRSKMWGTWGRAWKCSCSKDMPQDVSTGNSEDNPFAVKPLMFSAIRNEQTNRTSYIAVTMGEVPVAYCGNCQRQLPDIPFDGSFQELVKLGYIPMAESIDEPAFEVPGQGLGVFSCRKDAWPMFNVHFRGFGGEEMYIHEKFRKRGDKTLCLPALRWLHKFGRPRGIEYPATDYHKVRNYVLGHQELGIPMDRLKEHFLKAKFPDHEWDFILEDPIKHTNELAYQKFQNHQQGIASVYQPDLSITTPEGYLNWCKGVKRDLDEHLEYIAQLASMCSHVTEFSKRRESTVGLIGGLMGGMLKKIVSHNIEKDVLLDRLAEQFKDILYIFPNPSTDVADIEETDLLFIDSKHTAAGLHYELSKFGGKVRRFIVCHDTVLHGTTGEDGGPGLHSALKHFMLNNKEWFPVYHTTKQYGLSVIGRLPEDRPADLVWIWPPDGGPGTELKGMLKEIGIEANPGCDCNRKAEQMDLWGSAECRQRRQEIVQWIRDGYQHWGWRDVLKATFKSLKSGLALQLSATDPFGSLVDEAIERAEAKGWK